MRYLEDVKSNGSGLVGQWLGPSQLVWERSQNAAGFTCSHTGAPEQQYFPGLVSD